MASDMNAIKRNPGFIAFWGSNTKQDKSNTQVADVEKAKAEAAQAAGKYGDGNKNANGGEGGKG